MLPISQASENPSQKRTGQTVRNMVGYMENKGLQKAEEDFQ